MSNVTVGKQLSRPHVRSSQPLVWLKILQLYPTSQLNLYCLNFRYLIWRKDFSFLFLLSGIHDRTIESFSSRFRVYLFKKQCRVCKFLCFSKPKGMKCGIETSNVRIVMVCECVSAIVFDRALNIWRMRENEVLWNLSQLGVGQIWELVFWKLLKSQMSPFENIFSDHTYVPAQHLDASKFFNSTWSPWDRNPLHSNMPTFQFLLRSIHASSAWNVYVTRENFFPTHTLRQYITKASRRNGQDDSTLSVCQTAFFELQVYVFMHTASQTFRTTRTCLSSLYPSQNPSTFLTSSLDPHPQVLFFDPRSCQMTDASRNSNSITHTHTHTHTHYAHART